MNTHLYFEHNVRYIYYFSFNFCHIDIDIDSHKNNKHAQLRLNFNKSKPIKFLPFAFNNKGMITDCLKIVKWWLTDMNRQDMLTSLYDVLYPEAVHGKTSSVSYFTVLNSCQELWYSSVWFLLTEQWATQAVYWVCCLCYVSLWARSLSPYV